MIPRKAVQKPTLRCLDFYIIGELLHIGRQMKGETLVGVGLLVGFALAFAAEMIIALAGAQI